MKLLVLLGLLVAFPAEAKVRILRADFDKNGPHLADWRPSLKTWVQTIAPGLTPHDFVLHTGEDDTIEATAAVPFKTSDEALSVIILVQGSVRFMGNPEPVLQPGETEAAPIPGDYEVVKQAIDVVAKARPQHTRVALWVYGEAVAVKAPLGPPEAVTGDALGPQKDYAQVASRSLEGAIDEAIVALVDQPGRHVVFIIGDGGARRDDYDPRKDLDRLTAAHVEVYTLGASPRPTLQADRRRMQILGQVGGHRWADEKEQVVESAEALVAEMNGAYLVTFPGLPRGPAGEIVATMPFDGSEHEARVKAGAEESADVTLRFPGPFACLEGPRIRCVCWDGKPGPLCAKPPNPTPIWPWLLGGAALLLAGLATFLILRRSGDGEMALVEPQPAPAPVPVPAPAPTPAPDPARHTIMVDALQDDDDGWPLVAWIVPITGSAAFQTFRLGRRTVIGAARDCDVRVADDPQVSGRHAEIIQNGKSFILADVGSLNGVRFSDKKIDRHTLVDNDRFTVGTTDFKFKTTMD